MNLKYWEWETGAFKEKMKAPSIGHLAKALFENETQAYRFAAALAAVKRKGKLRLKDCGDELPLATWKRYLDYAVQIGLLKHEEGAYEFTDRFTSPMKNFASYVKEWMEKGGEEDLTVMFANAKREKQQKRGGKILGA